MKFKLLLLLAALVLAGPGCSTPVAKRQAKPTVVLVHGFMDTGFTFNVLRRRLEKDGFECFVPKMTPIDGRGGLDSLARNLKTEIDAELGRAAPISIVAFSMGGIVSRQYLQEMGGAKRCQKLITISSPHYGTTAAWFYPTKGAQDMRPGSPFLQNLEKTEGRLGKMSVASYRTPMDLVIFPASSSVWRRAENREFPVILHPLMLSSKPVIDEVAAQLSK